MSRAHITAKNQRDSPLLRLPPELRNRICALAISGHTIQLSIFGGKGQRIPDLWLLYEDSEPDSRRTFKYDSLNQVCRQLRHETVGWHISLNTFVGSPKDLIYFLDWCGADAAHLATVRIRPYYGISGGAVLADGHGVFEFSDTARILLNSLRRLPYIERIIFMSALLQDRDAILFAARLMFGQHHRVELRVDLSSSSLRSLT